MTPWRRYIQRIAADPAGPVLPCLAPRVFQPWPATLGIRTGSTSTSGRGTGKETVAAQAASCIRSCSAISSRSRTGGRHSSYSSKCAFGHIAHASAASTPPTSGLLPHRPDASLWYEAIAELSPQKVVRGTKDTSIDRGARTASRDSILDRVLDRYTKQATSRPRPQIDSYTVQAQKIIDRYQVWLKSMLHRQMAERLRLRRHYRELKAILGQDPYKAKIRHFAVSGTTSEGHVDLKAYDSIMQVRKVTRQSALRWDYNLARLNLRLLGSGGDSASTSSLSHSSKDASVWYSLIKQSETDPFEWGTLPRAISRSLEHIRRNELRKRVGLTAERIAGSRLSAMDDDFISALEETIWQDAMAKLWPEMKPGINQDPMIRRIWEEALLHVMAHSPLQTPSFLQRTNLEPLPPSHMIMDAFQYSVNWAQRHAAGDQSWWSQVATTISSMSLKASEGAIPELGQCLTVILRHLPVNDIPSCIADWQSSGVLVDGASLCHATDILSKNGLSQQALTVLQTNLELIVKSAPSSVVQSVLTTVLRGIAYKEDNLHICQDLVTRAIHYGVVPSLQLFNVIMLNAVEAMDVDFAFNIYSTMKTNKLTPDKYTFSILAKACKSTTVGEQKVSQVINDALRSGLLLTEPTVAGEVLHALYLQHKAKRPDNAYRLVIEAYEQLFDRSALEKLNLVQGTGSSTRPAHPLWPDAPVIGVVVSAYLTAGMPTQGQALALYQQILELAKQNLHPFPALFEADYVSNAFITYFGSNASTLPIAVGILRTAKSISERLKSNNPLANGAGEESPGESEVQDWFTESSDFQGLSDTTVGIVMNMFAKHSNPSNNLLATARRMLDHVMSEDSTVDPRALMEMMRAYLRHGDGAGADWCVERLVAMDAWDDARGSAIRRGIAEAHEKRGKA